jgi:hypothetical protein
VGHDRIQAPRVGRPRAAAAASANGASSTSPVRGKPPTPKSPRHPPPRPNHRRRRDRAACRVIDDQTKALAPSTLGRHTRESTFLLRSHLPRKRPK